MSTSSFQYCGRKFFLRVNLDVMCGQESNLKITMKSTLIHTRVMLRYTIFATVIGNKTYRRLKIYNEWSNKIKDVVTDDLCCLFEPFNKFANTWTSVVWLQRLYQFDNIRALQQSTFLGHGRQQEILMN